MLLYVVCLFSDTVYVDVKYDHDYFVSFGLLFVSWLVVMSCSVVYA